MSDEPITLEEAAGIAGVASFVNVVLDTIEDALRSRGLVVDDAK